MQARGAHAHRAGQWAVQGQAGWRCRGAGERDGQEGFGAECGDL